MSKTSKGLGAGIDEMLASAEEQLTVPSRDRKRVNNREKEVEVTINFKIPKSLHTALKIHAIQKGISIKDLAIRLFSNELNKK